MRSVLICIRFFLLNKTCVRLFGFFYVNIVTSLMGVFYVFKGWVVLYLASIIAQLVKTTSTVIASYDIYVNSSILFVFFCKFVSVKFLISYCIIFD